MTFQHTFTDGTRIAVAIDMDKPEPTITARVENREAFERNGQEYCLWLGHVVVPAVMEVANLEQMGYFASCGLRAGGWPVVIQIVKDVFGV